MARKTLVAPIDNDVDGTNDPGPVADASGVEDIAPGSAVPPDIPDEDEDEEDRATARRGRKRDRMLAARRMVKR